MPTSFYPVKVEVFGVHETEIALLRGMEAIEHTEPVMEDIRDDLMGNVIKTQFLSQGHRGGGSWAQLSHSWQVYKAKRGLDPRILFATHALYNSMTDPHDENADTTVTNTEILVDTYVEYGMVHQYGIGRVPPRPFVKILDTDVSRWARMVEEHIYRAMIPPL